MERVKTGITGLDEMLEGGFLKNTANLVEGAPGTGKTTLGMQFIYNGIMQYNEPGLIITFEEFPKQYYHDAAAFGWDFVELEKKGLLKVVMTSPETSQMDLKSVGGIIETHIDQMGAKRVIIDSISHFSRLTQDPVQLRSLEFDFINALKREQLTCLLTHESPVLLGEPSEELGIGFLVDSYIILRYVEIESIIRKALLVLKMRGSNHAKDIRQYDITEHGLEVQSKFEGQEGILSGSPRRMAASFVEAFVKRLPEADLQVLNRLEKLIINFISGILTIYIWGTVCVALYFLFAIARFYEEKSGRRSYYSLFLVPIGLFAIAAIKYSLLAPLISGDFWGDLLRFIGGITLIGTGYFLLRLMIGGRS